MNESIPNDDPLLDEQIVEFTDRLLEAQAGDVEISDDPELHSLQETILWMAEAVEKDQPDPAMANRIRTNLAAEWHKSHPQVQPVSFWARLKALNPFQGQGWQSQRSTQRRFAMGFAYAALAVLVLGLLFVQVLAPTTATAGGPAGFAFFALIGVALAVVAILWWVTRSKG